VSLDDTVHTALKDLIDQGLVQGFHTSRHAPFVEGGPTPDEVNVLAVLSAREPEEHRHDIEGRLHHAGLGKVVLRLHGGPISVNQPSDEPNTHIPADVTGEDEMRVRERAYLLWEGEGKPEGRLDEYWDRACELIDDESQSSYPPAQSRGHRT
jgi:hypothetical protein